MVRPRDALLRTCSAGTLVSILVLCALPPGAQVPALEFARQPLSSDYGERGHAAAIDTSGNTVVAGSFTHVFDIGSYNRRCYIASYIPEGVMQWSYTFGNNVDSEALDVAVDGAGSIYATGVFVGTVDFDRGEGNTVLSSGVGGAPFVIKIDEFGNFVWAKALATIESTASGECIALDTVGNVYIGGSFYGSVDADPGEGTAPLTTAGGKDGYLVKLDPSGNYVWARSFGGIGADSVTSIATDLSGSVVATGSFTGDANLDSVASDWPVISAGGQDFFMIEVFPTGNIDWAHAIGGPGDDATRAVAVDNFGNIHLAGSFRDTVNFDPDGQTQRTALGFSDGFLLTLHSIGTYTNLATFGSAGADEATAVAVDAFGKVYVGGFFEGDLTIRYSDGSQIMSATADPAQVFVSKLNPTSREWTFPLRSDEVLDLRDVAVEEGDVFALAGTFEGTMDAQLEGATPAIVTSAGEDAFIFKYRQGTTGGGVIFTDGALEAAVRDALGIAEGPIPFGAMAGLTELSAPGRGIRSVNGLQYAMALQFLDLSYNAISFLGNLEQVLDPGDVLDLYGNPLNVTALCETLPALESRGVVVGFEHPCDTVANSRLFGFVRSGGAPITCAAVVIMVGDGVLGAAVVDDVGYYEINSLAQGVEYTLRFEAPGFEPAVVARTLADREEELSVELAPDPATPDISGVVREEGLKDHAWPVPVARVRALQNGEVLGEAITCASGSFSLADLDLTGPGEVTLLVSALGYADTIVPVALKDAFVEVSMPKLNLPGSVIGTVVDPEELPADAAQVVVQQTPAGFSAVRVTEADGAFSVTNVPDGNYEVRAVVTGVGSGLNNGEVQQSLTTIDVELLEDLREGCVPPSPPAGVTASDGTDSDAVVVTWDSLGAGIEYRVLRASTTNVNSAEALTDWITGTTFSDTTAVAPAPSSGCSGGTTFTTHHYWVAAREVGADCESAPGGGDGGFRGAKAGYDTAQASIMYGGLIMALLLLSGRPRSRRLGPRSRAG